ncbi:MAG: sulfatase [Lentisphaeria bacterium]|nr:sulfatase [Lentisphaeria bacterium]
MTVEKPNIVYIHSHDTGRFVQPYGHPVPTPRIQQFAEEGVLFRRAYCAGPTCSPSRACLLTGTYAHTNGMHGLTHRDFAHRLKDYSWHITHPLRDAGYISALAGVQHIHQITDEAYRWIGYDMSIGGRGDGHNGAAEFLAQPHDKPFFLSVGFAETHRVFPEDHPGDDSRYTMPPPYFPDTPECREDFARFKASARRLDAKVGTVLDAIDANGLRDNTLVILTTDHGIAFPRMKCNLTDGGIGVMLMLRGPSGFSGGKVIDALVSHIDLFPTICALAGATPPDHLQGMSLLPLVNGEQSIRDEIHAEVNFHGSYQPTRCVRTDRFKYIRRFYDHGFYPSCDAGSTLSFWLENCAWDDLPLESEMLYDCLLDPNEAHNLLENPAYQTTLMDMRKRLGRWMTETDDPILRGTIPRPEGGGVYKPNCVSSKNQSRIDAIEFP